jgi:hypothetical protein
MRGVVSMAAALALPASFPQRELLVFVTFAVILVTLVGQGLTLPALIRRLEVVEPAGRAAVEEAKTRARIAQAALDRLDDWKPTSTCRPTGSSTCASTTSTASTSTRPDTPMGWTNPWCGSAASCWRRNGPSWGACAMTTASVRLCSAACVVTWTSRRPGWTAEPASPDSPTWSGPYGHRIWRVGGLAAALSLCGRRPAG